MTDWRSIDSAPRDGREILACPRGRPGQKLHWWKSPEGVEGWFTADRTHNVKDVTWWKPEGDA